MSHLDCLEEAEKQATIALINAIRDEHEHPLRMPGKTGGRYLTSGIAFEPLSKNDDAPGKHRISKQEASVSFLCMPYFLLAPYSSDAPSQASSWYPLRTLLQRWQMSTPKKREMQQAICDLHYSKEDYVFHVPQVWCLRLGDSKSRHECRCQYGMLVY